MAGKLDSKIAVVTGAGSGIGAGTARRFVEEGATVVLADIRLDAVTAVADELGDRARPLQLDVRSEQAVDQAMQDIGEQFGELHVLVNNAGTPIPGQIKDVSTEQWVKGMELNVNSVFFMTRAAWPLLVASGNGVVLNTASIAGMWGIPNEAPYCTSKAAVLMLTKCMALDGAREGVRVNCVCPGYTATPMIDSKFDEWDDPAQARKQAADLHPLGRLGTPEDMASAFLYLASDESSWVTGAAVPVDGGLTSGVWGGYVDPTQ